MSDSENPVGFSKKVFFLYPVGVVKDISKDLIKNGFETHQIDDHEKLHPLLQKYPGSIVYINIYEIMDEQKWEHYIRGLIADESLSNINIGICVYNTNLNDELMNKYLMDVGITAGFINVFTSYKKSIDSIIKVLNALEARGKRKFIRVSPLQNDLNTYIQTPLENTEVKGIIKDISVYCLLAEFNESCFTPNQILRRCVIKLKGVLLTCDMIVKGFLQENPKTFILIFVHKNEETKNKVFDYIFERVQKSL